MPVRRSSPTTFLLPALLIGALAVLPDAAQSEIQSEQRDTVASGDYIRAEFKGQLRKTAAAAGEPTGFQIVANGVTWEVDASGDATLLQVAERLNGKLAVTTGTFAQRREGSRMRRILSVKTLASGEQAERDEYVDVTVAGTLRAGIMAIGAETTGVTITANGVTWELELERKHNELASDLNGSKAVVLGRLRHAGGVEIKSRFIVKVRSLKAAQ